MHKLLFIVLIFGYYGSNCQTNEVKGIWSGALEANAIKVNAKLTSASTQVRLLVSTSPALTSPLFGPFGTANSSNNYMAALSINGLQSSTHYYYAIESDGITDMSADDIGSFTTLQPGAVSFRLVVGSCAFSGNHPVFTKMQEKSPLLALMIGDLHYANPNSSTDINVHRLAYETNIFNITPPAELFKHFPLAYVWDDHDYSGNDSDSLSAGKTNARLAYREYVPYYPLGAGIVADRPIYQSFHIGRIHFILTDLRSARRTPAMMGDIQKAWFKNECIWARDNNMIIAWVSSVSFGGNQVDNWGGFTTERRELSDFFRDNNIQNMFIMSGDAHMAAIDNGNNHDFSTGTTNSNRYPVLAAAALNQNGSYKGGTYSEAGTVIPPNGTANSYPNPNNTFGQYGIVDVTDNGGTQICIKFTINRVTNTGSESELVNYNFCRNMLAVVPVNLLNFRVKAMEGKSVALISWRVSPTYDCRLFDVEKSLNGVDFFSIGTVACPGIITSQDFNFTDNTLINGINYYRLRIEDANGKYLYSEIKNIKTADADPVLIYPNPVKKELMLHFSSFENSKALYIIYNASMQKMGEGAFTVSQGNTSIIPVSFLNNGMYLLRINRNGRTINKKFTVSR